MKKTYEEANKMLDCYNKLSDLEHAIETDVVHLIKIAENIKSISEKTKTFWETRNKIMESLAEKDKNGEIKKRHNKELNMPEMIFSTKNKILWAEKLEELANTEVEIEISNLEKVNFKNVKGLKPSYLVGILDTLV